MYVAENFEAQWQSTRNDGSAPICGAANEPHNDGFHSAYERGPELPSGEADQAGRPTIAALSRHKRSRASSLCASFDGSGKVTLPLT